MTAPQLRDVSFYVAVGASVVAAAVDAWGRAWTLLLLPCTLTFLLVQLRISFAAFDRLNTLRIAQAEAERRMAELSASEFERAVATGRVHVVEDRGRVQ